MNQSERFPPVAPLKFAPANLVLKAKYNTYGFDNALFWQQIRTFYQLRTNYARKVEGADVISIYLDSLVAGILVHIYDDRGREVTAPIFILSYYAIIGNKDSNYNQQYNTLYVELDFSPTGLNLLSGFYYIAIECLYASAGDPVNTWFISEPIHYRRTVFPKTMLFEYDNNINDYDVLFATLRQQQSVIDLRNHPTNFQFRVECTLDEVDPAFHDTGFEDQLYVVEKLQSVPYRIFTLIVGGNEGVPAWVIDKINRILSCDVFAIDGIYYRKDINATWSMTKVQGYSKKAATITLREANPNGGWEFTTPPIPYGPFRIFDDMFDDTFD